MDTPEKPHTKSEPEAPKRSSNKIALLVVCGVILIMGAFVTGWIGHAGFNRLHGPVAAHFFEDGPAMGLRSKMHGGPELINPTDGTSYTRLNGVVTQVSGSTFTIAGHGTTKTITTNSSTDYNGASKVQVNDTVLVLGTDSNGTFTAKNVHILNK